MPLKKKEIMQKLCLDWRIPAWELLRWGGSQLIHTILWICFPDHWFCFLMESFSCNWCTEICHHSNGNVPHNDYILSLRSCYRRCFVASTPPTCQRNAPAGLAGQNSPPWAWVSTLVFLITAHFVMCSSINRWGTKCPSQFFLCPY